MRPRHDTSSRGSIRVHVVRVTLSDGRPAPDIEVTLPPSPTVDWCLAAATDYATNTVDPVSHQRVAHRAYLALLDATGLRTEELKERMRGTDAWNDRYPRGASNGWTE